MIYDVFGKINGYFCKSELDPRLDARFDSRLDYEWISWLIPDLNLDLTPDLNLDLTPDLILDWIPAGPIKTKREAFPEMPLLMLRARTLVLSATKALGRIFPLPTDLVVARRNEQSLMRIEGA